MELLNICDGLVYNFLISNGHVKTAVLLLNIKLKNMFDILSMAKRFKGLLDITEIFSVHHQCGKCILERAALNITDMLVYNHMKENKQEKCAKLLLDIRKPAKFLQLPEEVKLENVIKMQYEKKEFSEFYSNKTKFEQNKIFPMRCSERIRKNKKNEIESILTKMEMIENDDSKLPLQIVCMPGKNRGIVTKKDFDKGDFVVEYAGEMIDCRKAKEREILYAQDISKGCYMYYFQNNGVQFCIDATDESGRYGRLINHSRLHANLLPKVIMNKNKLPHLILIAKCDIKPGTELLYDYGDRSRETIAANPWLAM